MLKYFSFCFCFLMCVLANIYGDVQGRVDVGPAYMHIDVLQAGHTVRTRKLWGAKGDASLIFSNGITIKPSVLFGDGDANVQSGSLGLGFSFPVCNQLVVTPLFGGTFTDFESKVQLPHIPVRLKEKIRSYGPFLEIDLCWTFADHWRIYGCYQYTWSRVHTLIKPLFDQKNDTQGSNYSAAIERDITNKWSINFGAAYNLSLSKEKHGIRGYGVKVGTTYWF